MKRKGGQQQRIKAARSEEESSAAGITQQSALVAFLLTLFAWGEFSPQRCQHIAALALEDLEKHHTNKHIVSDLKALASIGSNGAYPNKMHQDLMQRTKNISKVPQPYLFNAKFKSTAGVRFYLMSFSQPLLQSTRPHGSKAFAQTKPTLRHFGKPLSTIRFFTTILYCIESTGGGTPSPSLSTAMGFLWSELERPGQNS